MGVHNNRDIVGGTSDIHFGEQEGYYRDIAEIQTGNSKDSVM